MQLLFLAVVCGTFLPIYGNLLAGRNPDLEIHINDVGFSWETHKSVLWTINGGYTGKGLKVSQREDNLAGPRLTLNSSVLQPDRSYFYAAQVKYLNTPTGVVNFEASISMKTKKTGVSSSNSTKIGALTYQRSGTGWHRLGGDFRLPPVSASDYDEVQFYVVMPSEVDYVFDSAYMIELERKDVVTWRSEKDAKIIQERTNAITLTGVIADVFDLPQFQIKVEQISSPFKFGTAVKVDDFINPTNDFSAAYRAYFYDNFDMAVPENEMKWPGMEPTKGVYKSDRMDTFLDMMDAAGFPVRAHALVWGRSAMQPKWFFNSTTGELLLDADELSDEIDEWVNWVCKKYKNRFVHWDVYNEYLHDHFYEEILGNEDYVQILFARVAARCTGDLYINDYNVLRDGLNTLGQVDLAERLLAKGGHIDGVAAQTHIRTQHFNESSSFERMEYRLKLLCDTGLPVTISELSVHNDDENARANKLDEVLRLFYSEPCVKAVLLWGYSDQRIFEVDSAHTVGEELTPNAAGDTWHKLTRVDWKTNVTIQPTSSEVQETIVGHHGNYVVRALYKGEEIARSPFTLNKGQDVTLDMSFKVSTVIELSQNVANNNA